MQHWLYNQTHYFISGLGESPNPGIKNMNHHLNPTTGFDYFTTLKGEKLGILMAEATEEEVVFRVVSGIGTEHYRNAIRKKTAV